MRGARSFLLLALAFAPTLRAQAPVLARADSAFAAEDRALARELYAEVLRDDPSQSHAVFRLAQLEPDRRRALELFRRYGALEPRDPWGPMAEGDLLARMGRTREALAAYDRAARMAPGERDVSIGRARILSRAGRSSEARATLSAWLQAHPGDGEAWDLLGREERRAGRPRAAAASFAQAESAGGVAGAANRRRSALAAAAPDAEPAVIWQGDSDGNTTEGVGGGADVMIGDGTRFGATGHVGRISDGVSTVNSTDGAAVLSSRPAPSVNLEVRVGAREFARGFANAAWTTPEFDVRLRYRAPARGPALDLRAQRLALGTAPLLVANQVSRTEGRAALDLPVGPLRVRGGARLGVMQSPLEANNARTGADGALVLPLGDAVEWSAQYHVVGFQRASSAGYFAPRRAETVESGLYVEAGSEGPLSLEADLGGGVQRVARQGEAVGPWKPAFRAWSYLSLALGNSRALWTELEAYDAPFAPAGAVTSASWRYVSLTTGLRWSLR